MLSLQATISLDAAAPSTRADALSLIRWDVHVDWHERHECVSSSCSLSSSSAPTLTRLVQVPQVGDPARDHADRRRCVRPLFLIPPASCTPRLTRPLSQHVREPVRLLPALDAPQHDVAARAVRGVRCACLSLSLSRSLLPLRARLRLARLARRAPLRRRLRVRVRRCAHQRQQVRPRVRGEHLAALTPSRGDYPRRRAGPGHAQVLLRRCVLLSLARAASASCAAD